MTLSLLFPVLLLFFEVAHKLRLLLYAVSRRFSTAAEKSTIDIKCCIHGSIPHFQTLHAIDVVSAPLYDVTLNLV